VVKQSILYLRRFSTAAPVQSAIRRLKNPSKSEKAIDNARNFFHRIDEMTPDFLELTVDKFTFRIAGDRLYSAEGLWVLEEGEYAWIGISDYLQQRSGDIAFVEVKTAGSRLNVGEEIVVIETIKVNIGLCIPFECEVVEANPLMNASPEIINQDPYINGWIARIKPNNLTIDRVKLISSEVYFDKIKKEAEQEVGRT
jgi:glycine cleavage system H protein